MTPTIVARVAPVTRTEVAAYATKGVVMFVFVLTAFRALGKRHAGSFNVYDVVTLMAASNAVQNAITGGRGNLPVGLAVSTAIVLTAWIVTRTLVRHPRLQPVLGTPTILINHGIVLEEHIRRQHLTRADLATALRQHGLDDIDDVALAVLEPNGTISVVPRNATADE